MKSPVIVHSDAATRHTQRVAEAIAAELEAPVVDAECATPAMLAGYDLIGFGSGVYMGGLHAELHGLAKRMRPRPGQQAFVFSTAGTCSANYHDSLRDLLRKRGVQVVGEHTCPGSDSYRFPGSTINPDCPSPEDLEAAREFARRLRQRLADGGPVEPKGE